MANHTDDRKPDNGGLNVVAGIMIAVATVGLAAVLSAPKPDLKKYVAAVVNVVSATDMPSPIRYGKANQVFLAVNDALPHTAGVVATGQKVKGYEVYLPSNASAGNRTAFLKRPDGRLQAYVPETAMLGPMGLPDAPPDYLRVMPPTFRYGGYTFQQNSNAVFRDDAAPMQQVSTLLGHRVLAEVAGPEAHRNSLYVEVTPGGKTVRPYVPVEKLYSVSAEADGKVGLGGQPNPYPTTDGPNLPYQVAQDPKKPNAKVKLDPSGEVRPQ